jgi:glycosyltransferase involved in cell wall biosynthesis/SAM-dependent methyltransferase
LRVLIVTHFLGEEFAHGVERVVTQLSTELAADGVDVAIATTSEQRPEQDLGAWPRRSVNGLPVFAISAGPLDAFGTPNEEQSIQAMQRVLDAWMPDVVHITLLYGLHPSIVAHVKRWGAAVVLDCHSYELGCLRVMLRHFDGTPCSGPKGGYACASTCFAEQTEALATVQERLGALRAAAQAADRVIACSSFVAEWLQHNCDIGVSAAISPPIARPGGLSGALRGSPSSRGQLNLAVIGGVTDGKAPDTVIDAIGRAELGPTELLLLGPVQDEEYKAEIVRRAAAIAHLRLRLVGAFEPSQLSVLLSEVDALVVASRFPESYSLAAREAWSRGIPVLASRLGALTDAVEEGCNGFLFDHDDPGELASALRRLVAEPLLIPELRKGALRTPYVTTSAHRSAWQGVYGEITGASSTRNGRARWPQPSDAAAPDVVPTLAGSTAHTSGLQRELPRLLARLGVSTVLDVGCGDFNWMREVDLGGVVYTGVDVGFDVVMENRLRYGGPGRRFLCRDLTRDPLPRADLVLCRDVLIHFAGDDLVHAMAAIVDSGARYLLATTFLNRHENPPISLGGWRPLNMGLPPLSMPPPQDWLVETPPEHGFDDKRLALWDLHSVDRSSFWT